MDQEHRVRASDAEREQVAEALRQAMSEGRLTLAEGEERLAAVYATTYRDELPSITADLPPYQPSGRVDDGEQERTQGQRHGWRHGRRRPRPVIGLAVAAAVAAGVWAVVGGGPVWLAILLAIAAVGMLKHAACGHHGWDSGQGDAGCHPPYHRHHGHHGREHREPVSTPGQV